MSGVEQEFQKCDCDYRSHCLAHERKCFTAGYNAALKLVEETGSSHNNARDEICAVDPCRYCSKYPCGVNNHRHIQCEFSGRKLSPVA